MSWAGLSLVTDAEIGQLEPEAVSDKKPWGATTWPSARAEAKRDLRIWIEMDYPTIPGVADRVIDRWSADYAFSYTASAYTDVTAKASDDTVDDVNVATALTTASTDRLYLGASWAFVGLQWGLTGTKNAVASVMTVKYSGPAGWTTLTTSDGTAVSGATLGQAGRVTWSEPKDWQRIRFNGTGDEYFWVEVSVSAALTAGVTATQILGVRAPDALKRCACYLSLGHIYNGLSAASPGEERWRQQSEKYFTMARDLYAGLKVTSGLWLDVDNTGSLSASETLASQVGGHVFYRA